MGAVTLRWVSSGCCRRLQWFWCRALFVAALFVIGQVRPSCFSRFKVHVATYYGRASFPLRLPLEPWETPDARQQTESLANTLQCDKTETSEGKFIVLRCHYRITDGKMGTESVILGWTSLKATRLKARSAIYGYVGRKP